MRIRGKQKKRQRFREMQGEFVQKPQEYKGHWNEKYFKRSAPLHIEIGTGRGQFLATMASLHPEINYVGIEKFPEVIIRAHEKKVAQNASNEALVCFDATNILEIFGESEVDRIYLNFSDPWPKKKHADQRLTSRVFLAKYRQILKPGGEIHFKTDNRQLFEFSLNTFAEMDWKLRNVTLDLHNSGFEGNVMTEYEAKFAEQGLPIYRLEALRR
ncbi:tRNA (guanosine(46)-N7)-methyltransferase TrmB [Effusibacillus lacus]|uniref:tRNA (guanine-N(7)-)-methyltransferase n=1 Tax=Effusibacillus lacus TaxID=1348429 RepID=A0A292YJF4_9BACL|nr:tRNA (guanosine(46)-N7)-methyltransferase TrmB [Effusibacillus lacus]GAX91237.1 tRNA (guanosine(46)-N7)-methyltransferase TrmB [Effusibacillus lacus]